MSTPKFVAVNPHVGLSVRSCSDLSAFDALTKFKNEHMADVAKALKAQPGETIEVGLWTTKPGEQEERGFWVCDDFKGALYLVWEG